MGVDKNFIQSLINDKKIFKIQIQNDLISNYYAIDASDSNCLRVVTSYAEHHNIRPNSSIIPIGLVTRYIPYDSIDCVIVLDIPDDMKSKIPQEVLKSYTDEFYEESTNSFYISKLK